MSEEFKIGDIVSFKAETGTILGEIISIRDGLGFENCNVLKKDGSVTSIDPAYLTNYKNTFDPVTKPRHYNIHPSGVEIIQITEHMNFCLGNTIKYVCRAGIKTENPIEDLKKAKWYLEREIQRLEKDNNDKTA